MRYARCSFPSPQGLPLEQRLGSAKLVGLVASSALLTQALYREWRGQGGEYVWA